MKLTLHGRTYEKDGCLYLYWTNSGFSCRFRGTGVSAALTTTNVHPLYRGYLNVYVDGAFAPTATVCVTDDGVYALAEGLPAGEHTLVVRKRSESHCATVGVSELTVADGEWLSPPPAPTRTIEFVGDSITSGFGNMVSDGSGDFTTATEDGTMTYAVLTAKALGAEAQIVSRSGIRFVYSHPGLDKVDSWVQHYENTATLPEQPWGGCADKWDFAAHKSDVVVINLGTNDNGATVDGKRIPDAELTKDALVLLRLGRRCNPDALIVWIYGIMGSSRTAALKAAVEQFGDPRAVYFGLANEQQVTEGLGTANHPAIQTHINRSMDLAAFIAEKTSWTADFGVTMQAQLQLTGAHELSGYTADSADALRTALADGAALRTTVNGDWAAAIARIQDAYNALVSPADRNAEYIVIDDCDEASGWNIAPTGGADAADRKQGAGCLTATGEGDAPVTIFTARALHLPLPADWEDWYLECWLYVDNVEAATRGGGIELSQGIDVGSGDAGTARGLEQAASAHGRRTGRQSRTVPHTGKYPRVCGQ